MYMRKVALFFSPHADDVEFGCSFYYMSLLEQGYRVIQAVMTDGAFGTKNPNFKGKRLVKIREKELDNATKVFENATKKHIEVIRLGYTDGHLPFNAETRDKIVELIEKINPDKIFAPDPWYSQDYHPDHINTGRLVWFALKKLSSTVKAPIPLILFYSYAPNRYITVKPKYLEILSDAMSEHRSQVPPLGVKIVIKLIKIFILGKSLLKFRRLVKGYRNQDYNYKNEPIFPPEFENDKKIYQIKYHLFQLPTFKSYERLHDLSPEEIGMEIKK